MIFSQLLAPNLKLILLREELWIEPASCIALFGAVKGIQRRSILGLDFSYIRTPSLSPLPSFLSLHRPWPRYEALYPLNLDPAAQLVLSPSCHFKHNDAVYSLSPVDELLLFSTVFRAGSPSTRGSCWSFSAIAAIEGINYLATAGELVALSEQELVDCDTSYNQGCDGGLMDYAFEFVIQNGGIDSEADYPYTASQGKCNTSQVNSKVATIDHGYEDVPYNNEGALLKALTKQPVSVVFESGGRDFQLYISGVFTGSCGVQLDHGVAAVGYGTDNGKDYWIVRNSWGGHWGESGYIRMQRSTGKRYGTCGILIEPSYPTKTDANLVTSSTATS